MVRAIVWISVDFDGEFRAPSQQSDDLSEILPYLHLFSTQALGDCLGLPLPVAAAANEQFKSARKEHGDKDFAAVYEASKK